VVGLNPLIAARLSILPSEGAVIGWKQCRSGVIVKVLVPAQAARSNATGRKCRAEYVKVLEIGGASLAYSIHTEHTIYRVGETVVCDKWEPDRWIECGGGIHFYLTREEAVAH